MFSVANFHPKLLIFGRNDVIINDFSQSKYCSHFIKFNDFAIKRLTVNTREKKLNIYRKYNTIIIIKIQTRKVHSMRSKYLLIPATR